ncbi:hypothetical protein niasHT_027980 [Heterodera trifolii]|uniref:Cyclin-dependent kinase inhibitor domain-containing protein n=1 Tax=Heterodera trifolii TaxID=157864 RepID=A0ABD2KEN6_9BILA
MSDSQQSDQRTERVTRRSLFGSGRPNDTDEWLKNLENNAMEEKVRKWSFDFRIGCPLKKAGAESPSSSHVYEAIDEREVPEFYRTKTLRSVPKRRPLSIRSPLKSPLKASESLKSESNLASAKKEAANVLETPRKSKRLRKANSTESTPQKKKRNE